MKDWINNSYLVERREAALLPIAEARGSRAAEI